MSSRGTRHRVKVLLSAGLDFAYQSYDEFADWLDVLSSRRPTQGIEIGTYRGGSACLTLALLPSLRRLITVDSSDRRIRHSPHMIAVESRLSVVRGHSRDPAIVDTVRHLLNGAAVDFLFIDGDHSYEGVAGDFAAYEPFVKRGGVIGFHDISACTRLGATDAHGVERFWNELRSTAPERCISFERHFGIGVLTK